ncbi:ATP-binding cassette domain-containing protein [Acidimicrobiaceae bacterium USS-CC1]|uniref:ATP-binding cassette domain-containing protein n=1 Tax=Acidiferrimicrobium australe TaxID=2664430 RepID=A0ABW9QY20_9ACTN|nr:ATP-binding cassette domain-containing protein [Acidiferrimicrobium australe]
MGEATLAPPLRSDLGARDDVPAIATEKLTKRFGSFTALDGLDLEVRQGEVFGFLGPNGAGKSTTLRLLLGLIRPSSGSARILGTDARDVRHVHGRLAYVPGDVALWPRLTGAQCLTLFGRLHGSVDTALRDELVERFQLDTSKRARAYSKGNRQKVALVAAFATRADLILLDEPTSGLDPLMEAEFVRAVRDVASQGRTVFLSSHILGEVETLCHRVGILRAGRLIEVDDVSRLRTMHGTELDVDVDGPPPDVSHVPGVSRVDRTPEGIRVQLSGEPAPLIHALAPVNVTGLRSREASLEEIFLGYYDSDAAVDGHRDGGTGDGH